MIELGKQQVLRAVKEVEFGWYFAALDDVKAEERVLLPAKQVPEGCTIGTELSLFAYRDSSDRMIVTTAEPKIKLGEVARLSVVQVTKIGAFLDWGLEKDLLLPFREQTVRVAVGETCLVALYLDKSSRLCATMKLYPYLQKGGNFKKDDRVEGTVYELSDNFGAFVAVNDCYSARVPKQEVLSQLQPGMHIEARISAIKEDGKIDLSLREKAYIQMSVDADAVMKALDAHDGVLPFNDKATPETIRREMQMSKNEFKRAVGNLLKAGRIEITDTSIRKL